LAYLLGIDIGTSSLKAMAMDEHGKVAAVSSKGYDIDIPRQGYAEQDPSVWWEAAKYAIRDLIANSGVNPEAVKCIGMSGQMHSVVILDGDYSVIRPSIIWCDQRTPRQIEQLYARMGREAFAAITLNPAAVGFSAVSLMWIKEHEPENFERIRHFMLPKDYIRFRLTGEIGTDPSDASGTMLFDTKNMAWSEEILKAAGIDRGIMPAVHAPHEICGLVSEAAARETGLKKGTPVAFGGGDQPMQAIGNGIVENGAVSSTIGTGGQIFMKIDSPVYDTRLRTHTFCNAVNRTWNIIGGTLSAGLSLKWLKELMFSGQSFSDISAGVEGVPPGSGGLVFLPYLIGERSPHMDPLARGVFFGLTLAHTRLYLARSVMEGVAFSLKDSLDVFAELGLWPGKIIASGGGAKSAPWRQIQADVFGREIYTVGTKEQACTGAAIMAGMGCGVYRDIREACGNVITFDSRVTEPDKKNKALYEELFGVYRSLYGNNAELFKKLHACCGEAQ
jgi:xylulokinase